MYTGPIYVLISPFLYLPETRHHIGVNWNSEERSTKQICHQKSQLCFSLYKTQPNWSSKQNPFIIIFSLKRNYITNASKVGFIHTGHIQVQYKLRDGQRLRTEHLHTTPTTDIYIYTASDIFHFIFTISLLPLQTIYWKALQRTSTSTGTSMSLVTRNKADTVHG